METPMTREDTVTVKLAAGVGGTVHIAHGASYALQVNQGEVASAWSDGSPITRAEYENLLKPEGLFEIVEVGRRASDAFAQEGVNHGDSI